MVSIFDQLIAQEAAARAPVAVVIAGRPLYMTSHAGVTRVYHPGEKVEILACDAEQLEAEGLVFRHYEPRPLPAFPARKLPESFRLMQTGDNDGRQGFFSRNKKRR